MNDKHLTLEIKPVKGRSGNIATICLNRPKTGNALSEALIVQMHEALDQLEQNAVRLLILKASGKHFCTGADLNWMQQAQTLSKDDNYQDAKQLALLIQRLDKFSAPTLAVIQGAAFGGALGLITACDIAIASECARFCLSEVKLGLIPAVIGPYVVRAMGIRQARRYFLSAEMISSEQALKLNLIHERCPQHALSAKVTAVCEQLLYNAPLATVRAKHLLANIEHCPMGEQLIDYTCEQIATVRTSPEGQEGIAAFLAKRPPNWGGPVGENND